MLRKTKADGAPRATAARGYDDGAELRPIDQLPPLYKSDAEFLRSRGIYLAPGTKIVGDLPVDADDDQFRRVEDLPPLRESDAEKLRQRGVRVSPRRKIIPGS